MINVATVLDVTEAWVTLGLAALRNGLLATAIVAVGRFGALVLVLRKKFRSYDPRPPPPLRPTRSSPLSRPGPASGSLYGVGKLAVVQSPLD